MISLAAIFSFVIAIFAIGTNAETHTVRFVNKCGYGTVLSTGSDYTSNGPLISAIAYLQTGNCQFNGERCTLIETTLKNPTSPQAGSGSSSDISLIPPHQFSVPSRFEYYGGCNGAGATCNNANCPTAFRQPSDTFVQAQVQCQTSNVNLAITFCG